MFTVMLYYLLHLSARSVQVFFVFFVCEVETVFLFWRWYSNSEQLAESFFHRIFSRLLWTNVQRMAMKLLDQVFDR